MDRDGTFAAEGAAGLLSSRQRQCLALVAEGRTSKEIGRALNLSPSTVDNHLRAALERLGLNSRAEAARALQRFQVGDAAGAAASGSDQRMHGQAPEEVPAQVTPPEAGENNALNLLRLPLLGGAANKLSTRRRAFHLVQIALLGTMGMTAVTMTIAGLVQLLSR